MDSYQNEERGATIPDGMRRTIIPGLKLENHAQTTSNKVRPMQEDNAETRRFTPTPLQQQALRSVRLPQTNYQLHSNKTAAIKTPSPAKEVVTGQELFSHVQDQDTMRRLALKTSNDLDADLADHEQWRENLADLAEKQPLNPEVNVETLALDKNVANVAEAETQATDTVDPAAKALAQAREDAFKLWEEQASAQHTDATAVNQDTRPLSYVPAQPTRVDDKVYQANMSQQYVPDYQTEYAVPEEADIRSVDYQPNQKYNSAYSEADYVNQLAPEYTDYNYLDEDDSADSNERFQAYDNLMANPDQAAYEYHAKQNPDYAAEAYAQPQIDTATKQGQDTVYDDVATNNLQNDVNNQSATYRSKQTIGVKPTPSKYEAALANDTGLIGSLLTSGQDLLNLFNTLFTNFPEEACQKISQAKSLAFVPVALIYFVLYLIYGSAHLKNGGLLTSALTGETGISVWASLLITIITAICHVALYTLIFVLANYLSYHKRNFISILNAVAAVLLLKACFIPLYLIFNIFATSIVSILTTICFAWVILLTDKFVRQQGSPKFSKQADLVALIIASLVALMPTIIGILF